LILAAASGDTRCQSRIVLELITEAIADPKIGRAEALRRSMLSMRQTPRYRKLSAYGYDRGDFVFQVGEPDVPMTPDP
jgi:hypothetical protein